MVVRDRLFERLGGGLRHDHWIDGRPSEPTGGTYLPTIDPTTRQRGDEIAGGGEEDVRRAVTAADRAQPAWAGRSPGERSEVLSDLAAAVDRHRDELIEAERACTGKVPSQAATEIRLAGEYFRYYAGVIRADGGRTIDLGAGSHTYTRLEPFGIVAAITPWNLPLNQACRAVAPALAVGNAVVVKPSEFTSLSTLALAQLATAVGLPDGVLNVVTGLGPAVGTPLVQDPRVGRIAFTGSLSTGRHLAAIAAERIVPLTLELGGKSPLVAFADADLDAVVDAATRAVAINAGQVCSATTRILVQRAAHSEVVERLSLAMQQLRPGVDFGPIVTEAQFEKVRGYIDEACRVGLAPATGGGPYRDGPAAHGRYIEPTLFVDVPVTAAIAREEVFGPVLVTLPFEDEEDAVALANDSEYGLAASVWSGDVARGLRVAERIAAGQVSVNGGPLTVETPFGGYKQSGFGREKGLEALHDYVQIKTVSVSIA